MQKMQLVKDVEKGIELKELKEPKEPKEPKDPMGPMPEKKKYPVKLIVFLAIVVAVGACFLMAWKLFVVKKVVVEGNEIYTSDQIENWVLDDEYSWSSLYVFFKNKLNKTGEIPFVEDIDISLESPQTLKITVTEKGILGYVYISGLGKNAYFDKDGFVVELSGDVINGVTKVSGLDVDTAELYQKLELDNSSILKTLLSVTQLLKKYDRIPELIYVKDSDIILSYGDIQVNLGSGTSMNEKIVRMDQILPKLEGQTGTLHLENWVSSSSDAYFKIGELTNIPNDVQDVPNSNSSTDESSTSKSSDTSDSESESTDTENADSENADTDLTDDSQSDTDQSDDDDQKVTDTTGFGKTQTEDDDTEETESDQNDDSDTGTASDTDQ